MPPKLTSEVLLAAIQGFEAQKQHIDSQIAELRAMLSRGSANPAVAPEAPAPKRKKFSVAARRRMALAQKRRWANIRGESQPPSPATAEQARPKHRISEEGMKRIIAATKKRWALKRAEAAKADRVAKTSGTKKAAVKKSAAKTAPAKAPKKAVSVKKAATPPAQTLTEAGAQ